MLTTSLSENVASPLELSRIGKENEMKILPQRMARLRKMKRRKGIPMTIQMP